MLGSLSARHLTRAHLRASSASVAVSRTEPVVCAASVSTQGSKAADSELVWLRSCASCTARFGQSSSAYAAC